MTDSTLDRHVAGIAHGARNATFGQRMVAIRKARGMSQLQLAEATDIDASQICNYEKDRKTPGVPKMMVLAKALGVTCGQLCGADE